MMLSIATVCLLSLAVFLDLCERAEEGDDTY